VSRRRRPDPRQLPLPLQPFLPGLSHPAPASGLDVAGGLVPVRFATSCACGEDWTRREDLPSSHDLVAVLQDDAAPLLHVRCPDCGEPTPLHLDLADAC